MTYILNDMNGSIRDMLVIRNKFNIMAFQAVVEVPKNCFNRAKAIAYQIFGQTMSQKLVKDFD
jgi:hypothetical protein